MKPKIIKAIAGFALLAVAAAALPARAQNSKGPHPAMAPLDQYLMDRNAEIALARSAAPKSISADADVLVLGRHGYENAVQGKNGFVCIVERGWMEPFDSPDYANTKIRAPNCYNPQAAKSILPLTLKATELTVAGRSRTQIIDGINAFGRKEVPALLPGAMCYMMSKDAYLTDQDGHNMAHLMFFVPEGTAWGEDLTGSPVHVLQQEVLGAPSPVSLYIIPMRRWSDGTLAVAAP